MAETPDLASLKGQLFSGELSAGESVFVFNLDERLKRLQSYVEVSFSLLPTSSSSGALCCR